MRYPKFGRTQSPFTVRIVISAAGKPTDRETAWIGADYVARFTIGGITPEPETVRPHGNRGAFEFLRSPLDTAAELRFSLEAEGPGIAAGEIAVDAGEAVGCVGRAFARIWLAIAR